MKKLVLATIIAMMINSAPAMEPMPAQDLGLPKPTTGKIQTAIKRELAPRDVRLPHKPKLLRSNPHRFTAIRLANADPWAVPDDEDIMLDRHRAKITRARFFDDSVSPDIAQRLAQAREAAMAKYRETHV